MSGRVKGTARHPVRFVVACLLTVPLTLIALGVGVLVGVPFLPYLIVAALAALLTAWLVSR